ncbi:MAG TPA: hypothetical protein VJO72_04580, partial [Candidatus Dormibacteraeota bacterium]|nr:hypothetical protein [Candidatus Dormibacteraeota bacterium]
IPGMKTTRARRLTVLLPVALLLAACATTPSRPVRSEFADIPVPKGMTYVPDRSTIIETPNVKAARFVYRGRLELESLAAAMRTALEGIGWRLRGSTNTSASTTNQVYEKSGNFVQVVFWEGSWFTYMEVTASQALQALK